MKISIVVASLFLSTVYSYYRFIKIDDTYYTLQEKGKLALIDTSLVMKKSHFHFTTEQGDIIKLKAGDQKHYERLSIYTDTVIYNPQNPKTYWKFILYRNYDRDYQLKSYLIGFNFFTFLFVLTVMFFLRLLYNDFKRSISPHHATRESNIKN